MTELPVACRVAGVRCTPLAAGVVTMTTMMTMMMSGRRTLMRKACQADTLHQDIHLAVKGLKGSAVYTVFCDQSSVCRCQGFALSNTRAGACQVAITH